ncbi:MAG: GTPase [Bdellovibrionales bacterium]
MITPIAQLTALINDTFDTVEKYHPQDASLIRQELEKKFSEQILQVMLYGAYNAGKSTLINVLTGSELAVVNDTPTTFQVDQFDWNGIQLLDTPGVNAPIDHEEATDEQVKRSGLLLFVIREGDQDSKDLYQRLFQMLKCDKKVFILLNHQASNENDKLTAYQKIYSILTELAPTYGIDDSSISAIPVFPVNLKTALRARLKDSQKLLEHSGFLDFISGFDQWLKVYNHKSQIIATLQNMVQELWIEPAFQVLRQQTNSCETSQLSHLLSDRSVLEREKRIAANSAFGFIRQEVNLVKSNVHSVLASSANQAELDSQLQSIFSTVTAKTEDWLHAELDDINGKVSATVTHSFKDGSNDSKPNVLVDMTLDVAKKTVSDKDNLFKALKFGRKLKIPGLKGRWAKTLGRWAGKAAGALQVAATAYEIYKAGADEEKENMQKRQEAIELNQASEQVCSTVVQQINDSVSDMLEATFSERISSIQTEIDKLLDQKDSLGQDMELLSKYQS